MLLAVTLIMCENVINLVWIQGAHLIDIQNYIPLNEALLSIVCILELVVSFACWMLSLVRRVELNAWIIKFHSSFHLLPLTFAQYYFATLVTVTNFLHFQLVNASETDWLTKVVKITYSTCSCFWWFSFQLHGLWESCRIWELYGYRG